MGAAETLEHMEHVAHAGGDHGHGDHGHDAKKSESSLGMYIGITMATLGVLLAIAAAKVGGERTELVQTMIDQQNAHMKYQAQDIKHRSVVLTLRQIHSTILLGASTGASAALNKQDAASVANMADRYLLESVAAKAWVETFDPAISAHVVAQETYEFGQLFAEIGIVIASVALLTRRKAAWFVAIALGIAAMGFIGFTWIRTGKIVHAAEAKVEETGKEYRDMRNADKTTDEDQALSDAVRAWAGVAAPAHPGPSKHGE